MAKLPYYTLYPSDFDADERVRLMEDAELGLYLRCLNHAWLNDGLPEDPEEIRRLLRDTPNEFCMKWVRVSACFPVAEDGRRRNERQEKERAAALDKAEKAKKGAEASWQSRRNANAKQTHSGGIADAMLRASDSDSGSDSVVSSQKGSAEGKVCEFPKVEPLPADSEPAAKGFVSDWTAAGFVGPEDCEMWFFALAGKHPNRKNHGLARTRLLELVMVGQFNRMEFERWYEEQVPIWSRWPQYPNLHQLFLDAEWRFPSPARKPAVDYSDPKRYGPQGD